MMGNGFLMVPNIFMMMVRTEVMMVMDGKQMFAMIVLI